MTEFDCPEYTVPGWLDENGVPTSCVGDHPCPGLEAPECLMEPEAETEAPVTVQPTSGISQVVENVAPRELAETGVDPLTTLALGSVLLVTGLVACWKGGSRVYL